jgi:N-acetylmuramoyl-L-alanine amidase
MKRPIRFLTEKGTHSVLLCLLVFSLLSYNAQELFLPNAAIATDAGSLAVVVLDAGHGGIDGGTRGNSGVLEKDLNLRYALCLGELLSLLGYKVVYTRKDDSLVLKDGEDKYGMRKKCDLRNREMLMGEYADSCVVSIHMNAFPVSKYKGMQVYYANTEESRLLAQAIQQTVQRHLQTDNERVPKEADSSIYLLDGAKSPAVLVECGFLSNEEDEKNLSDESYQKRLCFLLLCAIMK